MAVLRLIESSAWELLRIALGVGLAAIGLVHGSEPGLLLQLVGVVLILTTLAEIWLVDFAAPPRLERTMRARTHPAVVTSEVPVLYATTEGQTRRIADRLVSCLRQQGIHSRAIDLAGPDAERIDWSRVRGAIVGASSHGCRHQRIAEQFVREHAADLNHQAAAFFSVSLSAASAQPEQRQAARRLAVEFPASLGWQPDLVSCLAGRLAYTQYGLLTRWIMKRIARKEGAATNTRQDYEFTNWEEVERLAENVAFAVRGQRLASPA